MTVLPKKATGLFVVMMRPYKWRLFAFFTISLGGIACWAASPFAVRQLINNISENGAVTSTAWLIVVAYVLLRLTDEWLWRIAEIIMRGTKPFMIERIRGLLFSYVLKKPYSFFVNTSSGKLGHYINQTTTTMNETVDITIWGVWPRAAGLALSSVFLFLAHWMLAVLFIAWLVLLLGYTVWRGKKFSRLVEKESEARSVASGLVVDALSNHLSVRVFNASSREEAALQLKQDIIIKRWRTSWKFGTITNIVKGSSAAVVSGIALSLILWLYNKGEINVGDIVLFVAYFGEASTSIWELAWSLDSYYRSFGTIDNALRGLETGEPERDFVHKVATPTASDLLLKNVAFSYPDQPNRKVLHEINVHIKQGERIGLVGHSGAGKTTLVSLLLNFYDTTEGEFRIGGAQVSDLTPSQMRELIAFVPQDTNLFNRTVAQNIAYANPRATREEIVQAAKDAQAYEFIEKLPNGFETEIGERGVKLSGGQRQRIAIARALLKNSPILILDEATSALDSVSEQAIQKAFVRAMKNRTSLVIAHRLSTLRHLDKIVVFDGGTIVEQGTHDKLVKANGLYADLWRRQKDGFIGD